MQITDILEIHGTNLFDLTTKLLNTVQLEQLINDKNTHIIIKPDIKFIENTLYYTSPVVLATIIKYLQDNKFTNIKIAIGSLVHDDLKQLLIDCKYDKIIDKLNVSFVGLNKHDYIEKTIGGIQYKIISDSLESNFFINLVASAKTTDTLMHNALFSMANLLHSDNRPLFKDSNYYKAIAFLNYLVKPQFTLVEPDVLSDIQAPKEIYATLDNLLADAYYATKLGYKPFEIEYIELASKLNIGCGDINKANILDLIDNTSTGNNNSHLASYINDSNPCEQCYQNLLTALSMLEKDNLLDKLPGKLFIGQGWREFSENGIGVGRCTAKFSQNIMGCPPSPEKTYNYLKDLLANK